MTINHKGIGKFKVTSGTWKSNLKLLGIGFILIIISNLAGYLIGGILNIIGLIIFLIGLLNLIVFCFYTLTKEK